MYSESTVSYENPTWAELEPEILVPDAIKNEKIKIEAAEVPLKRLGPIIAMSQATKSSNLDWALIRIECPNLRSSLLRISQNLQVQHIKASLRGAEDVQTITSSSGCLSGRIAGSSTFMQLPASTAFQEVWTVQLDGSLRKFSATIYTSFSKVDIQGLVTLDLGLSILVLEVYTATSLQEIHKLLSLSSSRHT